ncbi:MAG: glycoside hydrolase [Verrucomicrobia bacterium]|nr:glycoside hydrolase [Verrucomicrobiota bacterium]
MNLAGYRRKDGPRLRLLALVVGVVSCLAGLPAEPATSAHESLGAKPRASWPEPDATAKPWAYWHWMGSAVDSTNLIRELRRYADAGLGGMHIVPIYGAKGWEQRYLSYLSPAWMDALRVAVSEAGRLGLEIDMTLGTGWNFGGPHIPRELSCLRLAHRTVELQAGQQPAAIADRPSLLALLGETNDGCIVDLTDRVDSDGRVAWRAEGPGWRLRQVSITAGQPEVERAAPGGEGPMLNPFYRPALEAYLQRFDDAFARYSGPKPRAVYHDSYEYHGAAWAPNLPEEFARRRGYRLEDHRAELFGSTTNDLARRVQSDYRETLADLLLESLTQPWADWARRHGLLTRNQAHGSPGHLLDLYAAADIPETEMFAKDRDILVSKFASSAAHVVGRPLVAAETGTWVAENFTETLADLKGNVDDLFLAGVNHVFYHGTCYSPDEAAWPGWLFYAATQLNPRNPIWRDLPALNAYVTRCQSILQSGRADNDVLLYWPIHDLWYDQKPLVEELSVHRRHWFEGQAIGPLARSLWIQGYAFDFVSDRQLATARVVNRNIALPGGQYRALLVPRCRYVPIDTLRTMLDLARAGATIVFEHALPQDVPGRAAIEERRRELRTLVAPLRFKPLAKEDLRQAKIGKGRVLVGAARPALECARIRHETLSEGGQLAFVRRAIPEGAHYFLVNRGAEAFEGWVPLARQAREVLLLDPLTGRSGLGAVRSGARGDVRVFLRLEPHQSMILRAVDRQLSGTSPWLYAKPAGATTELAGRWHVEFIEGGPELPAPFETDRLGSWTQAGSEAAHRFAGTARYTLAFDAPLAAQSFQLDLGRVAQSARVRLNGRELGTVFLAPFRVELTGLKPRDNRLDIEVTSTAANRIRDLDRRGVQWKNFHDINFVSITYRPFDASNWPLQDAGLLGPVTLQPIQHFSSP